MQAALQDIRARITEAHARGTALRLRGAGTKDFYGEQFDGELLDLSTYSGITDYEPSELVISARCGTRLSTIESLLAQHGQCLPFEPPAFDGDPTIGGIVAAGLSGPQRMRAGAVRDFVLGAVLLPVEGEPLHFGGKVMKNVAGFDLSRLLCGSLGILGPIIEVSLKVLPLPQAQQTLCFEQTSDEALRSFTQWAGQPYPICAAAWSDDRVWIRLAGARMAVQQAHEELGGEQIDLEVATPWWQSIRNQTHRFFRGADTLWRLSMPTSAPQLDFHRAPLIEWGGALRWYALDLPADTIRAQASAGGGSAMLWRGSTHGQRFHPLQSGVLEIHRRLKAQFDPRGIFNRGRLIAQL